MLARSWAVGFLWAALVAAPAAIAEDWGDLTGRLVYFGKRPEPSQMGVRPLPNGALFHVDDESLLVDAKGGISNVVVYVRTPHVAINPELAKHVPREVVLAIQGFRLRPHVVPIWFDKQDLVFSNVDAVNYNLNLQPLGEGAIDSLLKPGDKLQYTFSRKQTLPVPVACNTHPWIKGYVLPRDNPYLAVSNSEGRFEIKGLPVGELEFQVWHEKAGYVDTREWAKGRFTHRIAAGPNDLGNIAIDKKVFQP